MARAEIILLELSSIADRHARGHNVLSPWAHTELLEQSLHRFPIISDFNVERT